MLVTDAGRLIRVPADQVRITGRQAMGVTLFRVDAGEHVTSVFPVLEDETDDNGGPDAAPRTKRRRCGCASDGRRTMGCDEPIDTQAARSACIPARSIRSPTAIST